MNRLAIIFGLSAVTLQLALAGIAGPLVIFEESSWNLNLDLFRSTIARNKTASLVAFSALIFTSLSGVGLIWLSVRNQKNRKSSGDRGQFN